MIIFIYLISTFSLSESRTIGSGSSSAFKPIDSQSTTTDSLSASTPVIPKPVSVDPETEKKVLLVLCDISLDIPAYASDIAEHTLKTLSYKVELPAVEALLKKFAAESLIRYVDWCSVNLF